MKIDSGLLTDFIISIPFIVYFLHQIRSKSKYYIFKCVVISFLCFYTILLNDSLANAIGVIIGFAIYTFAVRIFIEETKSTQIKTLRMVRNFLIDQGQFTDG